MKRIHCIAFVLSVVMCLTFVMIAFSGCKKDDESSHDLTYCEYIAPTCTTNGRKEVWYQAFTNKYFEDEDGRKEVSPEKVIIPALGHVMSYHEEVGATCTTDGNVSYWSCSVCNHTYADQFGNRILPNFTISHTGHIAVYNSEQSATCEHSGTKEFYSCLNCNKKFSDKECENSLSDSQLIIPMKSHSTTLLMNVDTTCLTNSESIDFLYLCNDCGRTFKDQACKNELNTSKLHDITLLDYVAPTCFNEGEIRHYHCNTCEKDFLDKACTQLINNTVIPAKGHDLTHFDEINATSLVDGQIEHFYCTSCDRYYTDNECSIAINRENIVVPATIGANIASYTFASVAFELLSYGYEVFNAVADINGEKAVGIGYTDCEEAWQFSGDDKKYISSGFYAFEMEARNASDVEDVVFLTPLDEWGKEIDDDEYGYVVAFQEDGMLDGHFIADGQYIKYASKNGEVSIERYDNDSNLYDLSLGSIFDFDKDEYEFIPYDEISSEPIKYVPLTEKINGEAIKKSIHSLLDEQEKNGYKVESITIAHVSLEALNALRGVLSQKETFNGYEFDYLNSLDFDNTKQYISFNDDGSITIKDTPPMPIENTKSFFDWLVDGLILVGAASIAIICVTFGGPAGAVVAAGVVGAGIEYFNQAVIQGKRFTDVNYAKVGIMAISGAIGAIVPCSGALGFLASGIVGGLTSAAMTAVDGGSWQDILISAGQGALTSVLMHGLFASCFVAGTKVLTDKGLVAIESVALGTLVASYCFETGKVEYQPVTKVFKNTTSDMVDVKLSNGKIITSTSNHPYYSESRNEYTNASSLQCGEKLMSYDGQVQSVDSVYKYKSDEVVEVYNISVLKNFNYYIGETAVLVHNQCRLNNAEATAAAKKLGYDKVNKVSIHGNAVFQNKKAPSYLKYITADADSHIGGVWKGASSIKNLMTKDLRSGTYDAILRRIGP